MPQDLGDGKSKAAARTGRGATGHWRRSSGSPGSEVASLKFGWVSRGTPKRKVSMFFRLREPKTGQSRLWGVGEEGGMQWLCKS